MAWSRCAVFGLQVDGLTSRCGHGVVGMPSCGPDNAADGWRCRLRFRFHHGRGGWSLMEPEYGEPWGRFRRWHGS